MATVKEIHLVRLLWRGPATNNAVGLTAAPCPEPRMEWLVLSA